MHTVVWVNLCKHLENSNPHRRLKLSDFHEMAINLRTRKERAFQTKIPAYNIDNGGRRLGIERRQFNYSHYYPERRIGDERRNIPERRAEVSAEANS